MLVWICFLSSMAFSKFRFFGVVPSCFRVCSFLLFVVVKLCYCVACFGCFEVVLGSDGFVLDYLNLI